MSSFAWYSTIGCVLASSGLVVMLLAADRFRRLVALNVAASGTLVVLLAVAGRSVEPDPVPHALALTGIVITVAFTGLGVVLARRIDELEDDDDDNCGDGERADRPSGDEERDQ
ncbi:MAG: NADH-quinone oxidoreductase subunit K [Dietzia sp.]